MKNAGVIVDTVIKFCEGSGMTISEMQDVALLLTERLGLMEREVYQASNTDGH